MEQLKTTRRTWGGCQGRFNGIDDHLSGELGLARVSKRSERERETERGYECQSLVLVLSTKGEEWEIEIRVGNREGRKG